ncbi:hypothetical protein C8J57DRAFT_1542249 [Mycena rebaudengoi]|nr:hypothetical protein C8J57DRAFT_1542249 [Mycena rebaudengoi]
MSLSGSIDMDPVNLQEFLDLQEEERLGKPSNVVNMANVLDGSETFNISHAGGEFAQSFDLQQGLEAEEDIEVEINPPNPRKKYVDNRTRRDRAQLCANAFEAQMADMLKAYMAWCAKGDGVPGPQAREGSPPAMEEVYELTVVDLYECYTQDVMLEPTAGGIAPSLILQGLMPCAPWTPTVAISTRVLELFRVTHVRCPQLAVQPFVKSLCDLHRVPFRPYLMQQFSIAYDVYLDLHRRADRKVKEALGRDASWRQRNPCPACTYKLEGEGDLIFEMLMTMDGNDSLKHVLRREPADDNVEGSVGKLSECKDTRDAGDGFFLDHAMVDEWAKTKVADMLPMDATSMFLIPECGTTLGD